MLPKNSIDYLWSDAFNGLGKLQVLDLSDNGCQDVREDTFRSLTSLRVVHSEKNNLGKFAFLPDRDGLLFRGLSELEEIYISSNCIRSLSEALFQDQVSLKVLKLDNHQLSGWDPNLFKFRKNISKLDISYNVISVLSERNFHDLNNLQELKGNPFICNCDLLWFREWMDSTYVAFSGKDSYTCHGPEEWRGKPLLEFTKDKIDCTFFSKYAIVGSGSAALFVSVISGIFCIQK